MPPVNEDPKQILELLDQLRFAQQRLKQVESELELIRQRRASVKHSSVDLVLILLRNIFALLPLGSRGRLTIGGFAIRVWAKIRGFRTQAPARVALTPGHPAVDRLPGPQPYDVFVFPIIDWSFRYQRPQQLAVRLARHGHRVFYFKTTFDTGSGDSTKDPDQVAANVWVVTLPTVGPGRIIYRHRPTLIETMVMVRAIEGFRSAVGPRAAVAMVQHPFWAPIAQAMSGSVLWYDLLDLHEGFSGSSNAVISLEDDLIRSARLVTVSSKPLLERAAPAGERVLLSRNAADHAHFSSVPAALPDKKQVVGYFGAISDWFDTKLVADVARLLPDCEFRLFGATVGANLAPLSGLQNVTLPGEVPYSELPRVMAEFSVCIIPFKRNELTRNTNPVKLYEYFAAGRPVVSVRLPEIEEYRQLVHIADDAEGFAKAIRTALRQHDPVSVAERKSFAAENSWDQRVEEIRSRLRRFFPKVSIIVLTYNGLELNRAFLESVDRFTRYPDWELVIVDNASVDGSAEFLADYAKGKANVVFVGNKTNLGFAAGINAGARLATGDYLVLCNNDTYVTPDWIPNLLAHFFRDSRIGILGPVTNNIGNEAKVDLVYSSMDEMIRVSGEYTAAHRHRRLDVAVAAFFCVMIPHRLWKEVGELDEKFGRGFFEDDDYAMRVRQKGYKVQVAEDVFVHHHLSSSFNLVPSEERKRLFEANQRYYESKWGPWRPHEYRRRTG